MPVPSVVSVFIKVTSRALPRQLKDHCGLQGTVGPTPQSQCAAYRVMPAGIAIPRGLAHRRIITLYIPSWSVPTRLQYVGQMETLRLLTNHSIPSIL
jgi:hypothetical protein